VLRFVRELADYEREPDAVVATEPMLDQALFGPSPRIFCDIAEWDGEPVGMALWFYNFSTWRGRHGIYLEDFYVTPSARGRGAGRALMARLARRCVEEGLDRMDWAVLTWNEPAMAVYRKLGAYANDEWGMWRLTGEALEMLAAEAR
jgi:GNAT superfamily N-acetyltransferase